MKRSKLFEAMPLFVREPLLNLYSRKLNRQRFGAFYQETLHFLRESQWWAPEEFENYQLQRLRDLLTGACQHVPFYRERYSLAQIEEISRDVRTPQEFLSAFPIIEKNTLRENTDAFTSTDPNLKTIGYATTSGTTGMPLRLPTDQYSPQIGQAFLRRFYDWMDLPDQFRSIRLSGNVIVPGGVKKPPFWLENKKRSQLFMSTYHISDSTIPYYLEKIEVYRPSLIDGYPSAIDTLAKYILNNGIRLAHCPTAIATTAETLEDHMRKEIEEAFQCKVFNQYASAEGAPLITECSHGTLHMNPESGVLELLNMNGTLPRPGEIAEMIVTSFRNRKTPLIRYRIEDTAVLPAGTDKCPCGRSMPSVGGISGRVDDILYSKDGRVLGVVNSRIFSLSSNIKKAQMIQKSLDHLLLRIVKAPSYSRMDQDEIINRCELSFGKDVKIDFEYTDDIPLSANGKFKRSVNEWKGKK